jgi:anaerobic selenocysteine-containing dehydrogenase
MQIREAKAVCRLCAGRCGMILSIDESGQLLQARADREHVMSQGYACIKGLETPAMHNSPQRLLHPLKRMPDGSFARIPLEQALDEIAAKLQDIIAADGARTGNDRARAGNDRARSVAMFRGTPNYANAAASWVARLFMKAIGSPCFFSTMTIDQSAKWVTDERLGTWAAGRQRFESADVFMAFGYNPLVSLLGGYGFYVNSPTRRMREAKARGLKLIVVDPRRTETAHFADIHLQPLPGEDATIAAGMLRMILREGWHDREFCARWAPGIDALAAAVEPFTPAYVARRARVPETQFRAAIEMFARDAKRGIAMTGTGPDMAAHSNLANHLVECLNVACGRFNREGERVANSGVLEPRRRPRAEARSPRRSWERGHKTRVRGLGRLMGEMMSCALPEEILTPGEGRIRALLCVAGNPASVFPDQKKTVEALRALDLLVVLDPAMTNTAKLAHYIIPPKLLFERPDGPIVWESVYYPVPFAQYSPAVATPPAGSEVADEWYVFWALAKRLGVTIDIVGTPLDMQQPPTSDQILDLITRDAQLPLAELRKQPGGVVFETEPQYVAPPRPDCSATFDVAPVDVVGEIAELALEPLASETGFTHRLAVRRMRDVVNSAYRDVPAIRKRVPYNPACLHPDDLAALGLASGDPVEIESGHGRVAAIVAADATLRPGVVTLTHGWGGLPDEGRSVEDAGSNSNLLTSLERDVQAINAMARFSGVPVRIHARNRGAFSPPVTPPDKPRS